MKYLKDSARDIAGSVSGVNSNEHLTSDGLYSIRANNDGIGWQMKATDYVDYQKKGHYMIIAGVIGSGLDTSYYGGKVNIRIYDYVSASVVLNKSYPTAVPPANIRTIFDLVKAAGLTLGLGDWANYEQVENVQKKFNDYIDSLPVGGVTEWRVPMDTIFPKTADLKTDVAWNPKAGTLDPTTNQPTGQWEYPDAKVYNGNPAWDFPIPQVKTGSDTIVSNPSTTYDKVLENVKTSTGEDVLVRDKADTGEGTGEETTKPPSDPLGRTPLPSLWQPWLYLLPFLEFLLACVMYVIRLAVFIFTIPLVPSVPIPAPYGQVVEFFKHISYKGVNTWDLLISVATLLFSLSIYKILRRVFNG